MSEEQAVQFVQQMQTLETYLSELSGLEQNLLGALRDAAGVIESINAMRQSPESDTLMPLGMGVFVPTKIMAGRKIVVDIGAGVAVEKDHASAINLLESQIKELETALHDASAKKQNVAAQLEQGRAQARQLMQMSQRPKTAS